LNNIRQKGIFKRVLKENGVFGGREIENFLKEFSKKKLYFFLNLEIYFCIGRSEDFAASNFISGKKCFHSISLSVLLLWSQFYKKLLCNL